MNTKQAIHRDISDSKVKSLYQISLGIGTALDLIKNSNVFFSNMCNFLELSHISIWQDKGGVLTLKNIQSTQEARQNTVENSNEFYNQLTSLEENTFTRLTDAILLGIEGDVQVYRFEELYIFLNKANDVDFLDEQNKLELIPLFQKFALSIKAGISHEYLLNEMVKRQRAENQLYRQELLYRFGANSLTEGLIVTDLDYKINFVNSAVRKITSKRKTELIGKSLDEALGRKEGAPISVRLSLKEKSHYKSEEIELLDKNDNSYWARIASADYIDSTGTSVGFIVTILDVTESSKVRRENEGNRQELKDLVDNMYDAILVVSKDGTIRNQNKAARRLTKYDEEELLSLNLNDLLHPEDKEDWSIHLEELYRAGYKSGFEGRILTKSNKEKFVEVNSTAIVENGIIVGSREILRDISERKELEQQRAISEKKLRLIIEQALDAVVTLNIKGEVLEWNPKAESIFKIKSADAKGKKLENLIFSDWQKKIFSLAMSNFEQLANSNQFNERVELVGTDSKGHSFPIEFSVAPIKQGKTTFYSAFIRDITDRKKQEGETARLLEELGSANQELKDFAYIVSHDLKAPLRSVGSLADWLLQDYGGKLDDEGNMLLTLLRQRIRRMHNLIEGVLQYSKLGRMQNEKELIAVEELLDEIIDTLDPDSSIRVSIADNMPQVVYDRIRLQQVFQNLISNAIKFLDKPEGKIHIGLEETESHYIFSVEDNGPGISEDHFNKIFQIFQTLQSKDEYESTGIGLSIVKRIVELNNGKVTVLSELGQGSTFSFSVPKMK